MLTRLKSALLLFAMAFRYVFARASFGDSMAMFLESGSLGPLQRRQALRVLIDLEVEASQNLAEDCHLRPAPGAMESIIEQVARLASARLSNEGISNEALSALLAIYTSIPAEKNDSFHTQLQKLLKEQLTLPQQKE